MKVEERGNLDTKYEHFYKSYNIIGKCELNTIEQTIELYRVMGNINI